MANAFHDNNVSQKNPRNNNEQENPLFPLCMAKNEIEGTTVW